LSLEWHNLYLEPKNHEQSLDVFIDFLSLHEDYRWASVLTAIRSGLQLPAAEIGALARLSILFGGMGSLNDIVFDRPEAQQKADGLLDTIFRDMKLYHGVPADRAEWKTLEEQYKMIFLQELNMRSEKSNSPRWASVPGSSPPGEFSRNFLDGTNLDIAEINIS
jgi:hypothetical protein